RSALCGRQSVERSLQFGLCQLQRLNTVLGQAVKARRVLQHCGVAPKLHVLQDVRHALLDGSILIGRPMQPRRKLRFKVGRSGIKAGRGGGKAHGETACWVMAWEKASMMGRIAACLSLSAA